MNVEATRRPGFWMAGRFTPRQVDLMVFGGAVALSIPALVRAVTVEHRSVLGVLLIVPFGTVPLLWRRTHPGRVLGVLVCAFAASVVVGNGEPPIAAGLLFGVGSAAMYGGRPVRRVAGVAALGGMILAFALLLATGEVRSLGHLTGIAFGAGIAWVIGDRARVRRAYLAELEDRAARLEREQAEREQRAAEEERGRIARELHDVVAHNVSVIAVQAGAARMSSSEDDGRAAEALGLIERTARSTLTELRTLLGILRRGDGEGPSLAPQPTLGHLDGLVERARAAGLRIELRVEGSLEGLPATVDLSAYRIVQEALTNVVKHAPGAHVHVLARRGERSLDVTVVDDGPGPRPDSTGGQGLIGMRERTALVGGTLTSGPALGRGFRVEARLPIDGSVDERRAASSEQLVHPRSR